MYVCLSTSALIKDQRFYKKVWMIMFYFIYSSSQFAHQKVLSKNMEALQNLMTLVCDE